MKKLKQGQLAFLANPKYEEFIYTTHASIIIINKDFDLKQPVAAALIRVDDAYSAFASLLRKYQEIMTQQLTGIQQPSYIAASARLGDTVYVGAFAYVGENVQIGNNVKLFPGVLYGQQCAHQRQYRIVCRCKNI